MKKYNLIFLFFVLNYLVYPQNNLVPNWSFEIGPGNYNNCAPDINVSAPPWKTPTVGSSDIIRKCNPTTWQWPLNHGGFCYPRTDTSYAGFYLYMFYHTPPHRIEYIQCKLNNKLNVNKKYCASFYISLGDSSCYATDAIGMYISDTAIYNYSSYNLNYIPQISNPKGNFITDTANWVLIKGVYTAHGGEEYITIGNFMGYATDTLATGVPKPIPPYIPYSYYYIDDVSVIEITEAEAGNDTTICNGDSVQLGTQGVAGVIYRWLTSEWLSDENISNPIAKPTSTTKFYLTVTDSITVCGTFVTTDSVTVTVAPEPCDIGVKELKVKSEKLKVYPNPASTEFIIESINKNINNINVVLFDMIGKSVIIEIKRNDNKIIIDVGKLREGIYFLILQNDKEINVEKVVIQK